MGFRRQKQSVLTERKWRQFVTENAALIQDVGLPQTIIDSEDYWTDTVVYGYAESAWNPADAFSGTLPNFDSHFEAGFPFFKPGGLHPKDAERLTQRFAAV